MGGEIVGGAAGRCGDNDAVAIVGQRLLQPRKRRGIEFRKTETPVAGKPAADHIGGNHFFGAHLGQPEKIGFQSHFFGAANRVNGNGFRNFFEFNPVCKEL